MSKKLHETDDMPLDPVAVESGNRIRAAMAREGYTFASLAAKTRSLSKSRIGNYAQGRRRMRLEDATELAVPLKVTAGYLMCVPEGESPSPPTLLETDVFDALPPKARTWLELIDALPSDEQEELMRALTEKKRRYDALLEELIRKRRERGKG